MSDQTDQIAGFKRQLKDAETDLAAISQRVEALRQVVSGLETLAAAGAQAASVAASAEVGRGGAVAGGVGPVEPPGGASQPASDGGESEDAQRKRAPRGLPNVLKDVMADGEERTVEEIEQLVAHHPKYEGANPPVRSSISNRLNEMAGKGEFTRIGRGTYKLVRDAIRAVDARPYGGGEAVPLERPVIRAANPSPGLAGSLSGPPGGSG
jgi:hypothetical protein